MENSLRNLEFLSKNYDLKYLKCGIFYFYIGSNSLTSLDGISGCKLLEEVHCQDNRIKSLNSEKLPPNIEIIECCSVYFM